VKLNFLYVKCCIEEFGLDTSECLAPENLTRHQWDTALARTDSVVSCLSAAMVFMRSFCGLNTDELRQITIMEYMKLFHVILVLQKLISDSFIAESELVVFDETLKLESYLLELMQRMGELVTLVPYENQQVDFFWQMRRVFGTIIQGFQTGILTVTKVKGFHEWCEHTLAGILRQESHQIDHFDLQTQQPQLLVNDSNSGF
jgi:hypothetical protein